MKTKNFKTAVFLMLFCFITNKSILAQVGIGTTTPDASSMLDIQSNAKGILMPRMTTVQRDAIVAPVEGLQIYNTTKKSSDIFTGGVWKSLSFSATTNLIYVYSLADLPTPAGGNITLDATKMYIFSGFVDISPNYITINGAGLRGTDPQKDMIVSNVAGAVLRSTNTDIFIQDLAIVPNSAGTMAYNVSGSSSNYFNSFSGASVIELATSLGVGTITGFKAITFIKNFWKVSNGIKITGTVGKFTGGFNFIEGIQAGGSGIEFLAGAVIDDIDLANNYFVYSGQTGVKVNAGASINRGRMTTNMFRNVGTPLTGIDSYSQGWSMRQNTNIPDSRAFGFIYFNNNLTATALPAASPFYYKIAGTTIMVNEKRFTASANRITYNGVTPIVGKISVVIGAKAPANSSDFSIGIAKNGVSIAAPVASMAAASNNQSFQIILNTELDLVLGDYIEVFIARNNASTTSIIVDELQFRVTD